jgi:hypothetical protein
LTERGEFITMFTVPLHPAAMRELPGRHDVNWVAALREICIRRFSGAIGAFSSGKYTSSMRK